MNYQHQSKEELINELNKLQKDYESLKVLFENHINDCKSINETLDKTRNALSESDHKFRDIVDYSTSIVLEWDTNGNILFLNKYGLDFFGFTEDEIIGRNVLGTIVEPKDSEGYDLESKMKVVQNNPENFYSSENENVKKNGEKVWIAWTNKAVYDEKKQLIKTLSVGIDRTEQRKMEKELHIYRDQLEIKVNERSKELIEANQQLQIAKEKAEESEIKYKDMMDNLQDAIFYADLDGNFTFANPTALLIYGYSSLSEIIGKPATTLYAEKKDREELINDLRKYGKKTDWNVKGLRKDGSSFWASMNAQLIYDRNGNVIGTQGVVRDITDRKQIENKLQESESLLKSIIDSTNDMIWSVDAEYFGLLNWNNSLHDYFFNDRDIEISIGMTPVDLFPVGSELISFWNDLYKQTILKGSHSLEYETITGRYLLQLNLNLILHEDKINGISIFAKNITEQKHNELKMKLSEEKFRAAFMTIKDGFYIGTLDEGIIIDVNPGFQNIFQYSFDESIGKSSSELDLWAIPEDRAIMINQLIENGYCDNLETIGRKKNGELFNASLTTAIIIIDQKPHIVGVIRDITERKQAEEALKQAKEKVEENESRLKLAIESGKFGIWDWDIKNNKMVWDKRMFELYGINKDSFPNNLDAWTNGLHPEDKEIAIEECNIAIKGEKDFNTSFRIIHPNGEVLYIKANGLVIYDNKGNPIRMIGINKDITQTKYTEEQLLLAKEKAEESDRLKTAFLNNISHEIRTPLNGILGFAPFVIDPDAAQQEKEQYLNVLDKSCQRLLNTVTDYMDMSLIVSGSMQVYPKQVNYNSLIETLHQQLKECCSEKNLEFNIQHSIIPDGVILKTDEELLMKALTHLLNNAVKFTPKGYITLGYELINHELEFFVGDSGVGINNDVKKRVFDAFMQENVSNTRGHEGSGLGLSIASGIVKLLGGKIRLVSEKMLGTTVFVRLPIEQNTNVKENADEISKIVQNKIPVVLIAEDDDLSFQYLEKIISNISDKIIRAFSGKEAIEICSSNPSINMILMDIKMPLLNGYEATRQIRKFNKDVIIIAQTAYAQTGDNYKAIEAGCNEYISKPIRKSDLVALLSKYSNIS